MRKTKQNEDYRTELEKKGKITYYTMSDGTEIRVLDFDLAEKPKEHIIFLIPGFVTVFQSWQRVMELLTPEFRVLYFESREKFSSKVPRKLERKITLHQMAYDIKEVIEQMKLDEQKYIAFCSSTGGTILVEALSEKWINPTGALMVGPTVEYNIKFFAPFGLRFVPGFMKTIIMPLIKWYIGKFQVNKEEDPEQYAKYVRAAEESAPRKIKALLRKMRKYRCWEMVPKIETRTLLVGASRDKTHSTEECLKVHELMPNSKYVDLGTNKNTHSDPVIEELKKFLEELT